MGWMQGVRAVRRAFQFAAAKQDARRVDQGAEGPGLGQPFVLAQHAVVGWRQELPQMAWRFGEPPNPRNQKIKTLSLKLNC